MIQKNLLKILFVEDIPSDVELAVLELRKEKFKFDYTIVCTKIELLKALKEFKPDLIISDYMMPAFNGMQALKESKAYNPDIPFILHTGSVNEETAVDCIKAGANDYVIKGHLQRLPFAVKEALDQVWINKEKRASELLLKDNEEKLQSIFSVAPVGIGLVVNRVLIEVNDSFCNMTGYTRKELIGKSSEIIYSSREEFISAGKDKYQQIEEKGTGSVETEFKCKDGKILNVILSSAPLDNHDHSKGITFTVLDNTVRKKAEDELARTNKAMSTLMGNIQGIVYRCRNDGNWTMEFMSEGTRDLTGYSPEDLLNNSKITYKDLIHEDDRDAIWADVQIAIKAKKHFQYTYRILTKRGEIRWVWEKGEGIFNVSGKLEFLEGFITDITERILGEKALRESEEKYRGIFENIQDVYYETTVTGTILEVSPSISVMSKGQYQTTDLIGKSMFDFYSEPKERQLILEALQTKGAVIDLEVTLKNRNGSLVPCSISAKILFDIDGHPGKIIGSMHDITDRKNATEALKLAKEKAEISDRLKTEFLNNISHEVRTPLNGILGFAEIITMQDLSEAEKKDSLRMLSESSNRLLNTISNYMDISLITSGNLSVNEKYFDPTMILKRTFSNFEHACHLRKLELFLDTHDKPNDYIIHSDPEICQKILSHFIENAIKFTEKGSIHFGFNSSAEELEFFVKDTGIGIKQESFNTIFDRFVKGNHGPYLASEGSGLGLSIARGMSEAIGGRIRLESEPGVGSCFFLTVPVKKGGELCFTGVPGKELKSVQSEFKILIAEDDEANFYFLNALIVRELSAKVLHASNGRKAIDLFKANPDIKLILMDIKMPEIDGFEATRQIRLIDRNVSIIAITAFAMSGDENRIMAAGFDGYLSKPINRKNLMEKIGESITIR